MTTRALLFFLSFALLPVVAALLPAALAGEAPQLSVSGEPDLRAGAVYLGTGLLGMLAHYISKWTKGEIDGSLIDYFVLDHGKRSISALMSFLGAAGSVVLTDQLAGLSLAQLVLMGFPAGYAIDSIVNKGTHPATRDVIHSGNH